jgi:hypothetical protein
MLKWLAWLSCLGVALSQARAWWRDGERAGRLASTRPAEPPEIAPMPRVSVLVAAWNAADWIERHIASVRSLRYPGVQYVLCAGGPDGTYALAEKAMDGWGVLLRQEPGEGKQRALRKALACATGEVIYLTDADCILDDLSFGLVIAQVTGSADAATGRVRPPDDDLARRPIVWCQWASEYYAHARVGDEDSGLQGANCAVARSALALAGDFAADVATGTDYHLARALIGAGVRIAVARGSHVVTAYPTTLSEYARRQSRWLRNLWQHGSRTGDTPMRQHAVRTWAVGVALLGLPLGAPLLGRWALAPWLLMVLHGALSRLRYLAFLARAERRSVPIAAWVLAPAWLFVDAWVWTRSLADQLNAAAREAW